MSEKSTQLNVELPPNIISAIRIRQAQLLEETSKRIKTKDIVFRALTLWLEVDGLGLQDALKTAKIEKAKVILFENTPEEIKIDSEAAADLFRALRKAVVTGEPT